MAEETLLLLSVSFSVLSMLLFCWFASLWHFYAASVCLKITFAARERERKRTETFVPRCVYLTLLAPNYLCEDATNKRIKRILAKWMGICLDYVCVCVWVCVVNV